VEASGKYSVMLKTGCAINAMIIYREIDSGRNLTGKAIRILAIRMLRN